MNHLGRSVLLAGSTSADDQPARAKPSPHLGVRLLDMSTWPVFARLVEVNNGVWGDCCCMGFHGKLGKGRTPSRTGRRSSSASKKAVPTPPSSSTPTTAWAGASSAHRRAARDQEQRRYDKELTQRTDWRSTCLFTGRGLRQRGVAHTALGGALAEIARQGGGAVEGYPEETDGRTVSGSFLHTGPMAAFEHHGFRRTRPISPHR